MTRTKIRIPVTRAQAGRRLVALDGIATATGWERAAIVYAFTEEDQQGRRHDLTSGDSPKLTATTFANLGIAGLRDRRIVANYRKAWQQAIDDYNAPVVQPGDSVEIGTEWKWPPTGISTSPNSPSDFRERLIAHPAETITKLLSDDPQAIVALANGVSDTPSVLRLVRERQAELIRDVVPMPQRDIDYSADLRAGVNRLMPVLHAMRDGKWEPDVMEQTLITFLARLFAEIADGNASETDLFTEIDAYLGAART